MKTLSIVSAVVLMNGLVACGDDASASGAGAAEGGGGGGTGGKPEGGASSGGGGGIGQGGIGEGGIGQGGAGGSEEPEPTTCDALEGMLIGPRCGVFVKAGASGDGSRDDPFGSILEAVEGLGEATHIYVCGHDSFHGSVSIPGGVSVTGGIYCSNWRYSKDHPRPWIVGTPDRPAFTISGAGESNLVSLNVEAVAAVAPGASSIAMVVSNATVTGDEMEIMAHDGAAGEPPADPPAALSAAAAGMNGAHYGDPLSNAAGGANTCGATILAGGAGGKGGLPNGANPTDGAAGDNGGGGSGGTRQVVGTPCSDGGDGGAGHVGDPGAGGAGFGTFSLLGIVASDGGAGAIGSHGKSGGGGGGGISLHSQEGPGGGGGGAGGCRGVAGAGGHGGGSSIALVSIDATVVFDIGVRLSVAAGGDGGAGGRGQKGQPGGSGGHGGIGTAQNACDGGHGGLGGHGGNGGGGRGGHSIAVVSFGTEVVGGERDIFYGVPGTGGPGGDNMASDPGGDGEPGQLAETVALEAL